MKRLNIFVDETGEFGFSKGSSRFYGVSFVFHEQNNQINLEIKRLERRLGGIGFDKMVHMGDLVAGHGDFKNMTIAERRKIFNCLYRFSVRINAKYHTIVIDKKYTNNNRSLSKQISNDIQRIKNKHLGYFHSFSKIVIYYDGGQKPLNKIIKNELLVFNNSIQVPDFDHIDKKLFQVADMLTYVDKLAFKYNKRIKMSNTEKMFCSQKTLRTILKELKSKRF